jgi:hypothetical protein
VATVVSHPKMCYTRCVQEIRYPEERKLLTLILEGTDSEALASYDKALAKWGTGSRNAVLMHAAANPQLRETIALKMATLPLEHAAGGHRVNPPVKLAQKTRHASVLAIARKHKAGPVREAAAKNPVTTDPERIAMLPDAAGRVWSAVARSLHSYNETNCDAIVANSRLPNHAVYDTHAFPFWEPILTQAPRAWGYQFLADRPNCRPSLIAAFQQTLILALREDPESPDWDMLATMPLNSSIRRMIIATPAAPEYLKVLAALSD